MVAHRIAVAFATACWLLSKIALAGDPAEADPSEPPRGGEPEGEPIDVVVTGTRVRTTPFDSAADVEVITGDRAHPTGGKSFRDALVGVTGVRLNARGEDPTFSDLEVRGLNTNATSGANVLILLDGIPQRRLSFGGPYMGALPFDAVSRIELVKGPMSSQYGRGSLAGAIQLFTHPGSEAPGATLRMMHEMVTDTQRGSLQLRGPLPMDDTTFSVTGSGTVSNGWQPRTNTRHGDVYVHVDSHLTFRDHLVLVGGFYDAAEQAVSPVLIDRDGNRLPGIDRDTNLGVPEQNTLDVEETRLAARYTHDFSPSTQLGLTVARWSADTLWKMGRPSDAPASGSVVTRTARNLGWEESSWLTEVQLQSRYEVISQVAGVLTGGVSQRRNRKVG